MHVSVFSTTFVEIFSILRRTEQDVMQMCIDLHGNYRYFGPNLMDLNFLYTITKNTQISNFMESRPEGADLFHTDGWTDVTKVTVAFRIFANAPKNQSVNVVWGKTALYSEILAKHLDRVHKLKEGYLNIKLVVHKVTTAFYSKVITQ
jgi:hypothetical protein